MYDLNGIANFIWGIADDVLRDLYVRGKYRDVILPMTVLRRLDAVLEPTKQAVLDMNVRLDKARIHQQGPRPAGRCRFDICNCPITMSAMVEPFARAFWPEVARFARRLPNFGYLKTIVRLHLDEKRPGGCYVWRAEGRIAAFCGLNYLNPDDAWLYGMRVAPSFHKRGIATRFTRALIATAGRDGRAWVGLNTSDQPSHRPVFRIAEKLGMKLEGIYCNDGFWSLRSRLAVPRLRHHPDIFEEFLKQGRTTVFHDTGGWFWSRLLLARREWVNADGYVLQGIPLHITRRTHPEHRKSATINLLELPPDPKRLLASLLAFAQGRNWIVVSYPLEWKSAVRSAWHELVPTLRRNHHYYAGAERVYGKHL